MLLAQTAKSITQSMQLNFKREDAMPIENDKTNMLKVTLPLVTATLLFTGCVTENTQLESINKDWNLLIRASHIYPIYPLSEDLEPGDLFFVSTQIDDLSTWSTPGYIKLDRQIARLYPTNYPAFYAHSFVTAQNDLPHYWLKD